MRIKILAKEIMTGRETFTRGQVVELPDLTARPLLDSGAAAQLVAGGEDAEATVAFASQAARELAEENDLTDTELAAVGPSSENGYTIPDVKKAIADREPDEGGGE